MKDIVVDPVDSNYAHVSCGLDISAELSDYFKFYVDGYKFNPKFKAGIWDGFIRLFAQRTGELPLGLVHMIPVFAKNNGYTCELSSAFNKTSIKREEFDTWLEATKVYSKGELIKPYWYQSDSVHHALESRRAILNLPTSAGKSLIIGLLSKYFLEGNDRKVLICVPNVQLVKQMQEDLIDYQLFVQEDLLGIKAGTDKDSDASIYISTWQSAVKQPKQWFQQFGMFLCDETHTASAMGLVKINNMMNLCPYKIGLTGSLKDAKAHTTQLIGLYGKVYRPVSTKQLMDEGKITELAPTALILKYDEPTSKSIKGIPYQDEIKWLLAHKKRNVFISRLATAKSTENTIVLFKQLKHGKLLFDIINKILEGTNRKVYYIAGDVKSDDREKYRNLIEHEKGAVIVASFGTMSTGVSIKNLNNAIFAHPTKSKIISLQSIGRILRKHKDKSKAYLYDIVDDLSYKKHRNFALKHGTERIKLYGREDFSYKIKKIKI